MTRMFYTRVDSTRPRGPRDTPGGSPSHGGPRRARTTRFEWPPDPASVRLSREQVDKKNRTSHHRRTRGDVVKRATHGSPRPGRRGQQGHAREPKNFPNRCPATCAQSLRNRGIATATESTSTQVSAP